MKRCLIGLAALLMLSSPAFASRIHILRQTTPNVFQCIIHTTVPAGSNAATPTPITWAAAIVAAGLATTSMTVGSGPGQITQPEANQIASGAVLETQFYWQDDPELTLAQRQASMDAAANAAVAETTARIASELKFFGSTRN